eukprot:2639012-Rhodomonas_salina.1
MGTFAIIRVPAHRQRIMHRSCHCIIQLHSPVPHTFGNDQQDVGGTWVTIQDGWPACTSGDQCDTWSASSMAFSALRRFERAASRTSTRPGVAIVDRTWQTRKYNKSQCRTIQSDFVGW